MTRCQLFDNKVEIPVQLISEFPGRRRLFIRRDDLIHPLVNGNKWWKLKYNIRQVVRHKLNGILSFGGAYSNHLHALAAAGHLCKISTVGIIRGEIISPINPTLKKVAAWGMELFPVSREEYRKVKTGIIPPQLPERYSDYFIIPEGGTNRWAFKGCSEMVDGEEFDYWCLSCGTGGTMAGVVDGLEGANRVLGFAALKGGEFLNKDIRSLLIRYGGGLWQNWELITDYHFGGYARTTSKLNEFINDFSQKYRITLDPIYTAKMLFGVMDLLKKGYFPENVKIVAVHSGGLQGIEGFYKNYGNPPI